MDTQTGYRSVVIGLSATIVAFALLRGIDVAFLEPLQAPRSIESFIGDSVRPIMALFAAATFGAFLSGRRLLWPLLAVVFVVQASSLAATYANRDDYLVPLRIVDLDWPGAVMALVTAVVAVMVGAWIRAQAEGAGQN